VAQGEGPEFKSQYRNKVGIYKNANHSSTYNTNLTTKENQSESVHNRIYFFKNVSTLISPKIEHSDI
jgi:hypothetical protein